MRNVSCALLDGGEAGGSGSGCAGAGCEGEGRKGQGPRDRAPDLRGACRVDGLVVRPTPTAEEVCRLLCIGA